MRRYVNFLLRLLQPRRKQSVIIMLGDSLVKHGLWYLLLGRRDVLNLGVSSERFDQIELRATQLSTPAARIIFVEGGINDLPSKDTATLLTAYSNLADYWRAKKVIPVITSLVFISPKAAQTYAWRRDWQAINVQVHAINQQLHQLCSQQNLDYIDLNALLSTSDQLRAEFTTDGVHFTNSAYRIWANEVATVLKKYHV